MTEIQFTQDWDQPETIPDPDAKRPEDWDDDMDGEWEPPVIDNPDFKGEWRPKQIDNPNYQGEWEPPMIANPKYFEDDKLYLQKDIKFVGIDIWQVSPFLVHSFVYLEIKLKIIVMINPRFESALLFKSLKFLPLQVKAGTIFDNILITDDEDFARNVAKETFEESAKGEKEKKEAKDEVR